MRVKKAQDGCKTVRTRRFRGDKPFRTRRGRGPMFQDGGKMEEPKLPGVRSVKKTDIKMKKAESGASLKPVPPAKKKSLGKLPKAVRNKMGFQKQGGKNKKMMGGGKCKYGC